MLVAASVEGCRGFAQSFDGQPGANGDCSHLADQCLAPMSMLPNRVYWCSPLAVHESTAMDRHTRRQFVRLSMPSNAPWHEGYTPSQYGVLPTGPIHGVRQGMSFRAAHAVRE
jgi:hypothetical protein